MPRPRHLRQRGLLVDSRQFFAGPRPARVLRSWRETARRLEKIGTPLLIEDVHLPARQRRTLIRGSLDEPLPPDYREQPPGVREFFRSPLECFSRRPTSLEVYSDEARFGRSAAYFVLRTFAHGIYLPTSSIALRLPPKVLAFLICFVYTSDPENSSVGTPCVPPGRNQLAQIQLRIRIRLSPTMLSIRVRRSGCSFLRPLPARWRFLGVAAGYRE